MKTLSIDIETTGLNKDRAEILEVGMVAFDTAVPFEGVNETNSLRIILVKNEWKGEVYALNLNKEIIAEILQAQKLFKNSSARLSINNAGDFPTVYVNAEEYSWNNPISILSNSSEDTDLNQVINNFLKANSFDKRITVAGKNFAGFDGPFLRNNSLFGDKFMSRFSHKVLDPGSMYVLPGDDQVPSLPICLERAGLLPEVPHTAIQDAVLVIKVLQAKMLK